MGASVYCQRPNDRTLVDVTVADACVQRYLTYQDTMGPSNLSQRTAWALLLVSLIFALAYGVIDLVAVLPEP